MGDMADDLEMHALKCAMEDERIEKLARAPKHTRGDVKWKTREGDIVRAKDVTDRHLFNAYMHSGADELFREMVVRLFEERVGKARKRR